MESKMVKRESIKKQDKRGQWKELLKSLTWDKAIQIKCPDNVTLRKYQPRIYEAALKLRKQVETFKTVEDGQIYLNIWLRNPS